VARRNEQGAEHLAELAELGPSFEALGEQWLDGVERPRRSPARPRQGVLGHDHRGDAPFVALSAPPEGVGTSLASLAAFATRGADPTPAHLARTDVATVATAAAAVPSMISEDHHQPHRIAGLQADRVIDHRLGDGDRA
jgi:hypothetical protein